MMVIAVEPELVRDIGPRDAILYAQIDYWCNKAAGGKSYNTVVRDGVTWVAKSRDELSEETGLTFKQVRDGLSKLKRVGLIQSEQRLHHGRAILHHRVGPFGTGGEDHLAPQGRPKWDHSSIETVKIESDSASGSDASLVSEKKKKIRKENSTGEVPLEEGEVPEENDMFVRFSEVSRPGQLEKVWRDAWMAGDFGVLPKPSSKEMGQFADYLARCPAGMAGPTIDYIVRNWSLFSSRAKDDRGLLKAPDKPTIGFALMNLTSAVNLYLEELEMEKKFRKKPKPKKVAAPKKVEPVKEEKVEDEDKPWLDLQKTIDGFDF